MGMQDMVYAGFWRRAVAAVIDLVLSAPVFMLLQALLGAHGVLAEVVFTLLFFGLYVVFFASAWQGSPGMRLMQVQIVDVRGERIGYGRTLWWVATSTVGAAIVFGGVLWMRSRFDLERINALLQGAQAQKIPAQEAIAEIEAIAGMPFAEFYGLLLTSFFVAMVLSLAWMLSVALSKQKVGVHNRLCATRLIRKR